jgi:two-component system chemotaxis sensor kinase CheA
MAIDMSQFYQVFFDESGEHLAEMERMLLEVDVDAPNIDDLNAIFRAAHSIKGGSGTFGFTDMTEVTHVLESLLDRLRKGEMQPRIDMIDAFLTATDVLKEQLNAHINGSTAERDPAEDIIAILNKLAVSDTAEPVIRDVEAVAETEADTATPPAPPTTAQTYRIVFTAKNKFAKQASVMERLIAELLMLGELEAISAPDLNKITSNKKGKKNKDKPLLQWEFRLTGDASAEAIRDIFSFVADADQLLIELCDVSVAEQYAGVGLFTPDALAEDEGYGFFGDLPAIEPEHSIPAEDPGYGFFDDPSPAAATAPSNDDDSYGFFQEIVPPVSEPTHTPAPVATSEPAKAVTSAKPATASAEATSIRVSVEKVDQLINLVGELVITQAMLAQTASTVDPVLHEALLNGLNQLERNTRDMQESVMSIRMMPISFVFNRFPRVVRDLASKLNKQVELVTVGENTELDKGLIEKIADPLTHLVRNSLDHGIELPDKRLAAGKHGKGTITLSASHQGGAIVIEVADDGAGLNREKILAKAAERGLPVSDSMTDQQVWQLIFAPGFSTADVVTDVSGRGVGMDVVIRNISEMGGAVDIESVYGWGTKITVRLPLTLAILDGMTVSVGDAVYVIPLNLIIETLQPRAEDIKSVTGQGKLLHVRGDYLPLIALHELFNTEPEFTDPTRGVLVMIEDKGRKAALFIDSLLGQQQVVIKSLETNYRKVQGISGATIMGDGRVALILDVPAIIKMGSND